MNLSGTKRTPRGEIIDSSREPLGNLEPCRDHWDTPKIHTREGLRPLPPTPKKNNHPLTTNSTNDSSHRRQWKSKNRTSPTRKTGRPNAEFDFQKRRAIVSSKNHWWAPNTLCHCTFPHSTPLYFTPPCTRNFPSTTFQLEVDPKT